MSSMAASFSIGLGKGTSSLVPNETKAIAASAAEVCFEFRSSLGRLKQNAGRVLNAVCEKPTSGAKAQSRLRNRRHD